MMSKTILLCLTTALFFALSFVADVTSAFSVVSHPFETSCRQQRRRRPQKQQQQQRQSTIVTTTPTTAAAAASASASSSRTLPFLVIDGFHGRIRLAAAADDNDGGDGGETAAADAEGVDQDDGKEGEGSVEEEEEEEVKEDPEVTALKQEIANMESALKAKKNQIDMANDQAERYSKKGYARRVAQVEMMKRQRMSSQSSGQLVAMASVLRDFLPLWDDLQSKKGKYGDDPFGRQYASMADNLETIWTKLGVAEYAPGEVGTIVDPSRVAGTERVHSDTAEMGTLLKPLSMGLELRGKTADESVVLRMAEAVISLGPETKEGDDAADDGGAKEEEEAAASASAAAGGGGGGRGEEGTAEESG